MVALPSPFVPLLYHTLRGLSRGFLNFFQEIFLGKSTYRFGSLLTLSSLHPYCITTWVISQGVFYIFLRTLPAGFADPFGLPLPLTMIVYHTPPQKSTWQNVQIRASKFFDFCTTFLLTNCWRYGIMEMARRAAVRGAANFVIMHNKKSPPLL